MSHPEHHHHHHHHHHDHAHHPYKKPEKHEGEANADAQKDASEELKGLSKLAPITTADNEAAFGLLAQRFDNSKNNDMDLKMALEFEASASALWTSIRDGPVVVQTAKIPQFANVLLRARTVLAVPPKTLFNMLCDGPTRLSWDSNYVTIRLLEADETGAGWNDLVHMTTKSPWPFSNRDYCCWRGKIADEKSNQYICIYRNAISDQAKETSNPVRADTIFTVMIVRAVEADPSKALLVMGGMCDLKGNIPVALMNWACTLGLDGWLKNVADVYEKQFKGK